MYKLNGKPLTLDRPFTVDGTQYPSNWLRMASEADKAALGITWEADPVTPDYRFYWSEGNPKAMEDKEEVDENGDAILDADGVQLVTKGLKSTWIAQVKDTAGKMLAETDGMVIRKAERDVPIDADVAAKRAAILAEANRLEAAISACADVDALITVVSAQNWE